MTQKERVECPRCKQAVRVLANRTRTHIHDCDPPHSSLGHGSRHLNCAVDLDTGRPVGIPESALRLLEFDASDTYSRRHEISDLLWAFFRAYDVEPSYAEAIVYQERIAETLSTRAFEVLRHIVKVYPLQPSAMEVCRELEAAGSDPRALIAMEGVTSVDELVNALRVAVQHINNTNRELERLGRPKRRYVEDVRDLLKLIRESGAQHPAYGDRFVSDGLGRKPSTTTSSDASASHDRTVIGHPDDA